MARRHTKSTVIALLSSAAPCSTRQVVSRRLNCCPARRNLNTSAAITSSTRPLLPLADRACRAGRRTYASSPPAKADIAVLGGGLTGLTTAYYLAKKLPPTSKITLYEASDRLGGWIRTERHPVDIGGKKGSVLFERGPRSLTSLHGNTWRYDDLVLYDLALDLGLDLRSPPSRPRYIYYPDHLVPLPPHINIFDALKEDVYLENIKAALTLLWKSTLGFKEKVDYSEKDPSISEWIYQVSNSINGPATLVSAMIHGIYGGDIDKLSAKSVLDRIYFGWYLPSPGYQSRPMPPAERALINTLGQDKQIQNMAVKPKSALLDFGAAGMQSLPDALAAALREQPNVTIKLNTPIESVKYDVAGDKVKISGSKSEDSLPAMYDKVISTLSAEHLAQTTRELPALAKSHSVDIMTVSLWFPEEDLKPPGFGYLIPRTVPDEQNPERALGVFFDSDVQERGPDEPAGTKLFVLMGGHYYERPGAAPPSEADAILQARALLERHLGIRRDASCYAVARLAKQCIPQHYVGHRDRMRTVHAELRNAFKGRLAVVGGSYTRIGAVAALRAGYDIATQTATDKEWRDTTGLEVLASTSDDTIILNLDDIPVRNLKGSRRREEP
ncbi:oxygen-dependent protoporphyrinogen oxidase [Neonectria punicea]|uniref:Protoporphyrinogen oxidase n=1 Tax=Neonectria punicea TaxID=979145 RepID=A0ABR1HMJ6_9HYPO